MNKWKILKKISEKKEFSKLTKLDLELAFSHFEKREVSDIEKIRLTRELLHRVFGAFTSKKLLSPKNKDEEWILRKHLSTRERLPNYPELYKRLLGDFNVIDLGAGINGFSYSFFPKKKIYVAVEAMGQLVDLMNSYFRKNNFLKAKAIHGSLFELGTIKKIIKEIKSPKVIFLFKVLDSLEMLKRDFSKELLKAITPLANKIVISFATRSMIKRKRFNVNRNWILKFIMENFKILDDFQIGSEHYIVFKSN